MRPRSLLLVTPAICVVVGLASGAAYAYFTGSGKGTGSAGVGSMQPVTITSATISHETPLLPGGSGDVTFQVTNPNSFAVTVVSVTGDGTITASNGQGGCTTTNMGVAFNPPTSLNTVINPNTTASIDLPGPPP